MRNMRRKGRRTEIDHAWLLNINETNLPSHNNEGIPSTQKGPDMRQSIPRICLVSSVCTLHSHRSSGNFSIQGRAGTWQAYLAIIAQSSNAISVSRAGQGAFLTLAGLSPSRDRSRSDAAGRMSQHVRPRTCHCLTVPSHPWAHVLNVPKTPFLSRTGSE